ncbi:hypothetical protein NQ166_11210 [Microbacterium sp. zg.Y1090]|uniref:hypothetical protein n=1 Tax=Microbacterium TaxID=33882 RepID=UPI00214C52D7|nr:MULTISPECIES: hypothetical protein [unclassified Microbacterium]MCR2813076.1 hypothetical protein [Microbacterium sp. zg.Y1084]MCR2819390.1 hypothetical protein [Microbacterium sp. zg.Y1090]MDL5487066.1 hypothetical protein [Microbacterium sp. zg-Y1211]WIM28369.1 hypothetical protein QNO26_00280 [Microbacterium sp. zg-Y1090]
MSRTINVVRMQLVNRLTYIWVPLLVLAGSLVITLAIYGILEYAGVAGPKYGGGAQAPLWYFGVVGIQALTLTFPFSQAMSVTRREFYAGTVLTAVLTSALLGLVFVVGGLLEQATDGWGMNGYFFYLPWVWEAGPLAAGFVFFVLALLFFVCGFWGATIYKRFGNLWLTVVLVALALALVALAWLITQTQSWGAFAEWFVAQGALGLALWGVALIAVLAVISWRTLRRAVP